MVGRAGLSAEVLRRAVEEAGGDAPRSHLATGNVTFAASPDRLDAIAAQLEEKIASVIGRREEVFIRSLDALATAVASEPFAHVMADDVYERCVTFFRTEVTPALAIPTQTERGDAVLFDTGPGQVFSITRLVGGRPGQPGRVIEAALGVRATTRNWNTIERIVRLEG
jgi:uncharacterized protein (DUF1697 family)